MAKSKHVSCSVLDTKIKILEYCQLVIQKNTQMFIQLQLRYIMGHKEKSYTRVSFIQTTTGAIVSAWHSSGGF